MRLSEDEPGSHVSLPEGISGQLEILNKHPYLIALLDAFPECAVIVNRGYRVLVANRAMHQVLHPNGGDSAIGKNLGNYMRCVHTADDMFSCGTSDACGLCGLNAVHIAAIAGKADVEECQLSTAANGTVTYSDYRVYSSPFPLENELFTVLSFVNIADEKQRTVLERLFFHDLKNTAGIIAGLSELIPRMDDEQEKSALLGRLANVSRHMAREIDSHQDLIAAEAGELEVQLEEIDVAELLGEVRARFTDHPVAQGKHIEAACDENVSTIRTDKALLSRSLGNLVKNALEAIPNGGTVSLSSSTNGSGEVSFLVENDGTIDPEVRLRIFHKSFTTKGVGRGLGTYSVKLLVEDYLHGTVGIEENNGNQTVFRISLPV